MADLIPAAADGAAADAEALVGLDRSLTWRELDERTAALAGTLAAAGIGPGDRVAIARRKGHESFVAVHGVLRSGAAYVPIDPLAPPAMMRQVLADADVAGVIGDAATIEALEPWHAGDRARLVVATGSPIVDPAVATVWSWKDAIAPERIGDLPPVGPDTVAYIIFTSGSTGRPKGIVHTHRSALAYATRAVAEYALGSQDRVAGMNPLHFDMSTLELFAAPLAGAAVVVMSEPHLQFPAAFTQRSAEHDVTVWYGVPFLLRGVVERGGLDRIALPQLRTILYGGEPYPGAHVRRLMEAVPGVPVVNVYGPAEVNACTHQHLADASSVGDEVPIGRPWEGAVVRVVDDDGNDAPPGSPGELWVSTPTVMRGYWRLADLTAARLHPSEHGPPWYATGDVVVLDHDGCLWFRGRRDHQVKVRGVRLELEAVETVLNDAPGVVHAVVGPLGPAGEASHLVAAVVLREGIDPDDRALRRWCADRLPAVAVPRTIEFLPTLPTTGSGKIDRATVRERLQRSAERM